MEKQRQISEKQTQNSYNTSFQSWQEKISKDILAILNSEISQDFIQVHQENFMGSSGNYNKINSREEIENNLIYNLTNIGTFLYKHFQDEAKDLILSIFKMYQEKTGLRFLGINWENKSEIPKKFQDYAIKKEIDEKYILYLLGKNFAGKKYSDVKDKKKKQENLDTYNQKIITLLKESSLFRTKVERKIKTHGKIQEIEYLRNLINHSFEKISSIESLSDAAWVDFVIKEGKKEEQELKKKIRKEKKSIHNITDPEKIQEVEEYIEELTESLYIAKNDIKLQLLDANSLSQEITQIMPEQEIEKFRKEFEEKKRIHDFIGLSLLQDQIIYTILKHFGRYYMEKDGTDSENAIPKNFFNTKSLTCFSGSWSLASILLKIGFDKDDIYIVNSFEGGNHYNHAYLVLRKSSGEYYRIDYGFQMLTHLSPKKNVDKILFFIQLGYQSAGFGSKSYVDGLDRSGRFYKLTDGILMMYINNIMHTLIQENKLEQALEYGKIGIAIDDRNPDLNEGFGHIEFKKGNFEHAIPFLKKSNTLLSWYLLGQIYYQQGNLEEAEKFIEVFIGSGTRARGIEKKLLSIAGDLLKKIKKENEKKNSMILGDGIEKHREFIFKIYDTYIKGDEKAYLDIIEEYSKKSDIDRQKIISLFSDYARNEKHTQPGEIIMDLVKNERKNKTKLYDKIHFTGFRLKI